MPITYNVRPVSERPEFLVVKLACMTLEPHSTELWQHALLRTVRIHSHEACHSVLLVFQPLPVLVLQTYLAYELAIDFVHGAALGRDDLIVALIA